MKVIVGLGNPGKKYESTRHNVGFMAIDQLCDQWNITMKSSTFQALLGKGSVDGEEIWLLKPLTYMNLSGESISAFLRYTKIPPTDLLILYDDLDTALGRIRLRYQGSAGGHNGIKSIIHHLGSQTFDRIRIGISRPDPGYEIVDYVLSKFSKKEEQALTSGLQQACDATAFALTQPFEKCMAKFN